MKWRKLLAGYSFILAMKFTVQVNFVLFNQKLCSLFIVISILFAFAKRGVDVLITLTTTKEMLKNNNVWFTGKARKRNHRFSVSVHFVQLFLLCSNYFFFLFLSNVLLCILIYALTFISDVFKKWILFVCRGECSMCGSSQY